MGSRNCDTMKIICICTIPTCFLVAATLGALILTNENATEESMCEESCVSIQVYYEALCPDSIRFIGNSLWPAWQIFRTKLNVQFKPFGKGKFNETGDGNFQFTCQHGPEECRANMDQTCLIHLIDEQEQLVPLLHCIEAAPYPPNYPEKCINQTGLQPSLIQSMSDCVTTIGPDLYHQIGVETKALDPPLTFVPWITFNGVYNEEDYNNALRDLKSLLCTKYLKGSPECEAETK